MPKIKIEMDQRFEFALAQHWITKSKEAPYFEGEFEVGEAFISNYERVMKEYYELQDLFEHMYRHQHGLKPYPESPYKETK